MVKVLEGNVYEEQLRSLFQCLVLMRRGSAPKSAQNLQNQFRHQSFSSTADVLILTLWYIEMHMQPMASLLKVPPTEKAVTEVAGCAASILSTQRS